MKDYNTIDSQSKQRAEENGKLISENTMIQMMKNYTWSVYSEGFDSIQTIY